MKNLFNPSVKDELFERINQLNLNSKALWGTMNVNQNLHHMAMLFEIAMGKFKATPAFEPPLPKWLLKPILLYLKMPKEKIKTLKEMNVLENNIDTHDFELEKEKLKNVIEEFIASPKLASEHSIGGKFSRKDWGKFTYKHTDYHLNQFGV